MLRKRFTRAALVVGSAAVLLVMAGCSEPGSQAANPEVPTIDSSSQVPPSSAPVQTPPSSSASQAPPTSSSTAPPENQNSGECQTTDLKPALGTGDGATGTLYRPLQFTNVGGRTCVIQGYPGVSYVAGDDGHQVGPAAFRTGTKGPPITLEPGMSAFADVGFVQVGNFEPAECQPTPVTGIRVYPPHEYDSMFVPAPGTGCAIAPPSNQLTVGTVQPEPGA